MGPKKQVTFLLLLPLLFGCKAESAPIASDSQFASQEDESANPIVLGSRIHEFHNSASSETFLSMHGSSDFQLIVDQSNAYAKKSAEFFQKEIKLATGVELPIHQESDEPSFDERAKRIYFGCSSKRSQAGLSLPPRDVGLSGYRLEHQGNCAFLYAKGDGGYNLGTLTMLRELLGYDGVRINRVVYSKTEGATSLPWADFDSYEIPDFSYRLNPGYGDKEYWQENGLCENPLISERKVWPWIHNVWDIMKDQYADHPDWFAEKGEKVSDTETVHQLCYLAHGNESSKKQMQQAVADKMWQLLLRHPEKHSISFTAEDNDIRCTCSACVAAKEKYGSEAGSIAQFLNGVDDLIQAKIKDTSRSDLNVIPVDHEMDIFFFGYGNNIQPPTKWNESEKKYEPIDESVVTHPHVGVIVAASPNLHHSLYEAVNRDVANMIKAWGAVSQKLFIFTYGTNFRGYLFPFNSWTTTTENAKFFKEQNADYYYESCSWENLTQPGFQEYKKYLNIKSMIDVGIDVDETTSHYFDIAYREAKDEMMSLFQREKAHCLELEKEYTGKVSEEDQVRYAQYWPKEMLLNWESLCEQAETKIASLYQTSDPSTYEAVKEGITIESITPRFALLWLYPDAYDADTMKEKRKALKADLDALSYTHYKEWDEGLLSNLYEDWGIAD